MDKQALRDYCITKIGAEETFPFDTVTLVIKVMGKMFALLSLDISNDQPARINLKCDPAWAEILRSTYPAVIPGYHMDKRHWITVICDGSIPDKEIKLMIDESYALVVKKLPRAAREELQRLENA